MSSGLEITLDESEAASEAAALAAVLLLEVTLRPLNGSEGMMVEGLVTRHAALLVEVLYLFLNLPSPYFLYFILF